MLHADVRHDYVRMQLGDLDTIPPARVEQGFAGLEAEARHTLDSEGFAAGDTRLTRLVDLRYQSQQWDITVPLRRSWDPARIRATSRRSTSASTATSSPHGAIGHAPAAPDRTPAAAARPTLDAAIGAAPACVRGVLHIRDRWVDTPVYEGWTAPGPVARRPGDRRRATTTVLSESATV
jgi:N-methylhydantoinase A/oxoprolinase/acetone carboxylase beta subunit